MAPQQNSTLIDENLEICPSLLNIPEEIIRYSPILPPKSKHNFDKNNNNKDVNFFPKCEQLDMEPRHYNKYIHNRASTNRSGYSRRSRSISLYGSNSTTVEQGHKEITIWLDDELRYVSGVTNKTTCNDIIKALIDDEISNGNYKYCKSLKDGTASRDYSDYVITECWRGIERSYDGNMAILPIWKAWSRVQNEIRLSLKHHKDIQDPTKALKTNTTLSSIRNYISKMLSFGKNKKSNKKSKYIKKNPAKLNNDNKSKRIEKENYLKTDEFMVLPNHYTKYPLPQLPIYPALQQHGYKEKKSKVKNHFEEPTFKTKTNLNREKLYKLSETRSSIRKNRSYRRRKDKKSALEKNDDNNIGDVNNFIRKRKDSSIRSSVRNKLAQKNAEMNDLYEREYALTKELTSKCKIYKLHNELYTSSNNNLELSVGQIQRNIEACAKEIIQTEHELLEIKNEIKQDISIINNLKRLTLDANLKQCGVQNIDRVGDLNKENTTEPNPKANESNEIKHTSEQMLFVDNIYEFCDNNASMLV